MNVSVVYRIWGQVDDGPPVEHPARNQDAVRDPGAAQRELARRRYKEPDKDWWVTAVRVTEWPYDGLKALSAVPDPRGRYRARGGALPYVITTMAPPV